MQGIFFTKSCLFSPCNEQLITTLNRYQFDIPVGVFNRNIGKDAIPKSPPKDWTDLILNSNVTNEQLAALFEEIEEEYSGEGDEFLFMHRVDEEDVARRLVEAWTKVTMDNASKSTPFQ